MCTAWPAAGAPVLPESCFWPPGRIKSSRSRRQGQPVLQNPLHVSALSVLSRVSHDRGVAYGWGWIKLRDSEALRGSNNREFGRSRIPHRQQCDSSAPPWPLRATPDVDNATPPLQPWPARFHLGNKQNVFFACVRWGCWTAMPCHAAVSQGHQMTAGRCRGRSPH